MATVRANGDISVALCTYNGAHFIEEQLLSILNQDPAPAEIVVSDDGSTDGTLRIIRDVFDEFTARVQTSTRLVVLENRAPLGVVRNFEQAVRACTGAFIALSDQDDVWHAGRLPRIVAALDAADRCLAHTDARLVDQAGTALGVTLLGALWVTDEERLLEASGSGFDALLRRNLATGATMVFRRELVELATPFPSEWVHDEWLAMIASATGGICLLPEVTIDYRQHSSNQIGVQKPTLRYKVGRVLEPRGDRNARIAAQFEVLVGRLEALGSAIDAGHLHRAQRKAAFESFRAGLPAARLRRVRSILSADRQGLYRTFASRGRADVLRDLLQPV